HVVGGKPAAHAFVLQVGVEALGESMIFAGVADEAGVVLDRIVQQRGQMLNQAVGKPYAAAEHNRKRTELLQGLKINTAWSRMIEMVQALRFNKRGGREYSVVQMRPGQVRPGQVRQV